MVSSSRLQARAETEKVQRTLTGTGVPVSAISNDKSKIVKPVIYGPSTGRRGGGYGRKLHLDGEKYCNSCARWRPPSEYHRNRRNWDGLHSFCKDCMSAAASRRFQADRERILQRSRDYQRKHPERRRAGRLKARFGITPDEYKSLYAKQNGRCAICEAPHAVLHVDHDHATKRIRGLLCFLCNTGIGSFRDSVEALRAAARYLSCE